MADTTLNLGNFEFAGVEIPAQINGLGISQQLATHRLLGGDRTIDAMGQDFKPITWSGLFFGAGALNRMNELKAMAAAGLPQTLLWHSFNYLVAIREFDADENRQFDIPYRIVLEVISDNSNPAAQQATFPTTDDSLNADLLAAQTLTVAVNDSTLTSLMASLSAAMGNVATFASAVSSVVQSVLLPLSAALGYVNSLMATTDTSLGSMAGFGGVAAGIDAVKISLALQSAAIYAYEEYQLLQLAGILGRMGTNLNSINGSPNTHVTVGGNLFAIASDEYGDTDAWTAIATANKITDPFISGPATLTIPLAPTPSGGILSN